MIPQIPNTPPELQYNNIWPKGYYASFKQNRILPIQGTEGFWAGQTVKILFQSFANSSMVMDPYRSHLQIEVEVLPEFLPVGLLQVDSSAHSFIEQLVLSSKNKQIERIPEYGVLAAWLTDLGLSQIHAQGRQTQGLGYTNLDSLSMNTKHTNSFISSDAAGFDSSTLSTSIPITGNGTVFPTQNSNAFMSRTGPYNDTDGPYSKTLLGKNVKGHVNPVNMAWLGQTKEVPWEVKSYPFPGKTEATQNAVQTAIAAHGYVKNLRAQYVQSMQSLSYPDSTTSRPTYQINLNSQIFTRDDVNQEFKQKTLYKPYIPQTIKYNMNVWTNTTSTSYTAYKNEVANQTSLHGFSSLYAPNFCKGVRQPFISPTVPQCQMKNGKILPQKIPISKRIFKIPLISAVLGILIPQDQFVLIPLKALNQLLIEIVLDQHAMFTSGYNDIGQFDDVGINLQQTRCFRVRRMQYVLHTYSFADKIIQEYISKSLTSKIILNSQMWTLANQYTLSKGAVQGNHFITCNSQALNEVVCLFYSNDYQKYSFCRKHFRLSNNIVKFQLRNSTDYFPPQPLLGNGGNPLPVEELDNSAYMQQVHWSNNFMFNKANPAVRINPYNFAINDRCYDPTRVGTYYNEKVFVQKSSHMWNPSSVNQDTGLGMPWIHENRYVGKAGYVFSFEPFAHSAYHLTGLDCRASSGFAALFSIHPEDIYPRQQTLFIFTRSSVIVAYGNDGINVIGR